ncbi:glycosyltransferase [Chloroflexota bacterium]
MIFVITGTHYQGFERLIKKMDEIAAKTNENVIIQVGYAKYKPETAEYFDFVPYAKIVELCREARAVICTDGSGSMITAIKCGKIPIVVPRKQEYGEAAYNTKSSLAREFAKENVITLLEDTDKLEVELKKDRYYVTVPPRKDNLASKLKEYIENIG